MLEGSDDGQSWTLLDERAGERFRERLQTRPFQVPAPGRYGAYRIVVSENTGEAATALAEVELLVGAADAAPPPGPGPGPGPGDPGGGGGGGAPGPGGPGETAAPGRPAGEPVVRIRRRSLYVNRRRLTRVLVRCPRSTATRCRGTLSIERGRRVLARRTFSIAPDRYRALTLRVSRTAYRALRASRGRRMRVSVSLLTRGRDRVLRRDAAALQRERGARRDGRLTMRMARR